MRSTIRPDLGLLQIFDAIYWKGGVGAAARHLNLSQPAISHALAKLRHQLGDDLFVRQGNALVPTAKARLLADPVRRALSELSGAVDNAASFDPARSHREFRIGIRLSGEMARFPRIVSRLRREAPNAGLVSMTFRRRDAVRALASGDLDLLFDVSSDKWSAQLCSALASSEPLAVATREDHPLVRPPLDLETYLSLEHVVATSRARGPGLEDLALAQRGLVRKVAVRCQHFMTAWQIVATSDLALTLPASQAGMLNAVWPLRLHPLPVPIEARDSYLYWHRGSQNEPGIAWLRQLILDELAQA